tara:strand:- start:339 stop:635 length:297 start_codon:yes stop_codon:yes gene_type:complete
MFEIENFLLKSNLKSNLKRYKSALIYPFIIGSFIGSTTFIYKSIENFRFQKLIQEQIKIEIQNKEKICKDDNSEYKKLMTLGFPKTAIKKFNICIQEQ